MDDVLLVILAGGKGERLRPLTNTCPKPLLQFQGCCCMQHALHKALKSNIQRVAIVGHHHFETIKRAVGKMSAKPHSLSILKEDQPRGTGGCLHAVMNLEFNKLVILYADIFFETPLQKIISDHDQAGSVLTLGVSSEEIEVPYGVVNCNRDKVSGFQEKRHKISVFAGVAVMSREFLNRVKWGTAFGFDALVEKALSDQLHVISSEVVGWTHLSTDTLHQLTPFEEIS